MFPFSISVFCQTLRVNMKGEIKTWFQLSILIFCSHLCFFLSAGGTGDKTTKVVTAASKVGIGGVVVAVAVVAAIRKTVVVAKPVVAVVTGVCVRSIAVGKVAVADGPVAVSAVEIPGIGLGFWIGFGFSLSFPLLPC